jgi:hypothetical protein
VKLAKGNRKQGKKCEMNDERKEEEEERKQSHQWMKSKRKKFM